MKAVVSFNIKPPCTAVLPFYHFIICFIHIIISLDKDSSSHDVSLHIYCSVVSVAFYRFVRLLLTASLL